MNDDLKHNLSAAAAVIATIIIVFIVLIVSGSYLDKFRAGSHGSLELELPLLVIAGLVSLLGMLAVMAIAFKTVHLANQTQALGLPEGTVRAVIALSLILIFAVIAVYLFSDLSGPDSESCCQVIAAQMQTMNTGTSAVATTSSAVQTSTTTTTATAGGGGASGASGSTGLPGATGPTGPAVPQQTAKAGAAQDFAKQLLIMLGTLITSITSFYFGSKASGDTAPQQQRPATGPAPQVSGLTPSSSGPAGEVKVSGTGLLTVDRVALRQGAEEMPAMNVRSSATEVIFDVPAQIRGGLWQVALKTHDGVEITAPGTLAI